MKKFLVLLLISALAIFVFAGCEGLVPAEGEGEGEGEGETEAVTVEIEDMQVLDGKNWVAGGNHDITVTFPAPATNVSASITGCSGYYGKNGGDVVLFPNEDKTVWTGSGTFAGPDCCASYVEVISGECVDEVCIIFPVIVDSGDPYAKIEIAIDEDACECGGCAVTFDSETIENECSEVECCGDDCSGLAGWSIAIYEDDPFDVCCEIPCEEPIDSCSGTECPIQCTTTCLDEDTLYYAVVTLVDNVGNEVRYYATLNLTGGEDCILEVTEYCADVQDCTCTSFDECAIMDTDEYIGFCDDLCDNCCTPNAG